MTDHTQTANVTYAGRDESQRQFFAEHEMYLADMSLDIRDFDKTLMVFDLPHKMLHITQPLFKFSHLQAYFLPCKLTVEGMAIYGFIYSTHVKPASIKWRCYYRWRLNIQNMP